jgi:beta-lactamase class A
MLKAQQDRGGIPRFLDGLTIANKGGAVDAARNDVGVVYAKNGPIIISAFLSTNKEVNWSWDNPGQLVIGKLSKAIVDAWL